MSLEKILGINLNGEGVASLLNIKALELSQAASADEQAIRLKEFNEGIAGLQVQLDAIDNSHHSISEVHVDSVSSTLADALALGTYDSTSHAWTFQDGTVIGAGDSIILQAASDPKDRSWIHTGATAGNASDFERLSSDIQALIDAGVAAVMGALRDGVPTAGDTLNKLYTYAQSLESLITAQAVEISELQDALTLLNTEVDQKADIFQTQVTFAPSSTAGIYEASIANSSGNADAIIALKQEVSAGVMTTVPQSAYTDLVSETTVILRTMSPSMNGQTYDLVIEG